MADEEDSKKLQPIIVKKIIKGGGGHHGGAWKVAYADFVTAMMAFFLLMWLLNATTEEQKEGISDYFAPSKSVTDLNVSQSVSGADALLAGQSIAIDGAMVTTVQPLINTPEDVTKLELDTTGNPKEDSLEALRIRAEAEEQANFDEIENEIKQALQEDPELTNLAKNLIIDETPEGLRIQIIDQEGQSMFPSGSAQMFPRMKDLLQKLASIIKKKPNELSIRGHTDSIPYNGRGGYSNWELSADRANASRRVLEDAGFPGKQIADVVGRADTDHLFPEKPKSEQNRRISIILIKDEITKARDAAQGKGVGGEDYMRQPMKNKQRSNSIIDFK